jgi:hypothetical protein
MKGREMAKIMRQGSQEKGEKGSYQGLLDSKPEQPELASYDYK